MFEIVLIVASKVLLVLLGFLLYRKLTAWLGAHKLFGRGDTSRKAAARGQMGFVNLGAPRTSRLKTSTSSNYKAPWGW